MRISLRFQPIIALAIFGLALILADHFLPCECMAQKSADAQAQLYFFTDHGCAPCRQVEPGIEALKLEGYPVETVYLSQHRELGRRMGVDRTPTVVLLTGDKMAGRHAGLIDAVTLKKWFAAVGVSAGSNFARGADKPVGGTKIVIDKPEDHSSAGSSTKASLASTMLKGTSNPRNEKERLALQATVKLKVEDPKGISYATGTVIHSHQGEYLVMTCGHVFREAGWDGEIAAEYGFAKGQKKSAPGQLIFFDADARDVALVAIRTSDLIDPVRIAPRQSDIEPGQTIFSLGCDHGDDPTIRHSRIKNRAAYDGAIKYDIYGRPVDGRSGGGLFNDRGELIGVCNAAAVEVDEGIYTALDTLYWQLAKVNLEHLFDGSKDASLSELASSNSRPSGARSFSQELRPKSDLVALNSGGSSRGSIGRASLAGGLGRTQVAWDRSNQGRSANRSIDRSAQSANAAASQQEVIIIVRSKTGSAEAETITVSDPGPQLLQYLKTMNNPAAGTKLQLDMAQLRELN